MADVFTKRNAISYRACQDAIHTYRDWGGFTADADRYTNPIVDVALVVQIVESHQLVEILRRCHRVTTEAHRSVLYPESALLARLRWTGPRMARRQLTPSRRPVGGQPHSAPRFRRCALSQQRARRVSAA